MMLPVVTLAQTENRFKKKFKEADLEFSKKIDWQEFEKEVKIASKKAALLTDYQLKLDDIIGNEKRVELLMIFTNYLEEKKLFDSYRVNPFYTVRRFIDDTSREK